MMHFENPDNGERLEIGYTPELSAALAAARGPDCEHITTAIRARVVQGGGIQVKPQCLDCGLPIGNPLRKSDHPNAEGFDEALLAARELDEKRARWNAAREYLRRRDLGELDFQRDYSDYLTSPEWRRRRELVFKRCSGICEGCMESNAREVHHLTYRNFRSEFLFELVALCRQCHSRIHNHTENDDPNSRPCRSCRFQDGDGAICPVFDVSEPIALSDPTYCGPNLLGFQALK